MHLELEQINALLGNRIDESERSQLVEHILNCEACAQRFKLLHAFSTSAPVKPARHPMRWATGAAAVAVMALYPLYRDRQMPADAQTQQATQVQASLSQTSSPSEQAAVEQTQPKIEGGVMIVAAPESLGILQKVAAVEKPASTQNWGQGTTVLQLIQKQNARRRG